MCVHYAGIYLWIYDNVTLDQIKIKFNERWVSNFSRLKFYLWLSQYDKILFGEISLGVWSRSEKEIKFYENCGIKCKFTLI